MGRLIRRSFRIGRYSSGRTDGWISGYGLHGECWVARDGVVAISSFYHPERQGEEPHFREWFREAGYAVVDLPRDTPFEGEGDALFSADGSRLWAGHGTRTLEASHGALQRLWDVEVVSLRLIDPRFYHLDTCFAPLEDGSLLYYPPAFDEESLEEDRSGVSGREADRG